MASGFISRARQVGNFWASLLHRPTVALANLNSFDATTVAVLLDIAGLDSFLSAWMIDIKKVSLQFLGSPTGAEKATATDN